MSARRARHWDSGPFKCDLRAGTHRHAADVVPALASLMGWLPRSTTARGGAIRLRPQAQGNRQSVQRPKIYCLLALQERMMPFALMQQVVDFVGPHT